jgi:hypothetical protein
MADAPSPRSAAAFLAARGGRPLARSARIVSQSALETALGKLICDEAFRRDFYRDAESAARHSGLHLTPVELTSLRRIKLSRLESVARDLDDRVKRAEAPEPRRRT